MAGAEDSFDQTAEFRLEKIRDRHRVCCSQSQYRKKDAVAFALRESAQSKWPDQIIVVVCSGKESLFINGKQLIRGA